MVGFDIPFAFVAAGALSWRYRAHNTSLPLLYAGAGVAVPGLAFMEKYPDKKTVSDEILNSIVGQLRIKVALLELKQEGVAKHRKICSENNLVSCM